MNPSTLSVILRDEAMIFPAIVSLLHAYQLANMAKHVGSLRRHFKIYPPAIIGDPAFERGFRAQQNTLEFTPIFMILLWIAAKFLNPVLVSVTALLYIKARSDYFSGYCTSAQERKDPFGRSINIIMLLFAYTCVGLTHTILSTYFNVNIPKIVGLGDFML